MDSLLSVHSRAEPKVCVFFIILIIIDLAALIIFTVNYCFSKYSLDYLIENDPDIDLTGLRGFSFIERGNEPYSPSISNLGTTGKIYFDCYEGKCKYEKKYTCEKTRCTGSGEKKKCEKYKTTCYDYKTRSNDECSNTCRKKKEDYKDGCGLTVCGSYYNNYHYYSSSCSRDEDDDYYSSDGSCDADNLILYWKYLFYRRENNTNYKKYTYLNSAITANESCPLGKRECGILDDLGNKYCLPTSEKCPINYITFQDGEFGYNYTSKTFFDRTIYYTNEATDKKIVGGLFADSDLLIKYKDEDCTILDNSTVSILINSQYSKIYRDFENIKQGKSYLKWCIPGHGKEKNITKIKELKVIYDYNVTTNKNIINPIKSKETAAYFLSLAGYIIYFLGLLLSFLSFLKIFCEYWDGMNLLLFISLLLANVFIIIGSIISIVNNSDISDGMKLEIGTTIFSTLKKLNITIFSINMTIVFLSIIFILYLYLTPSYEPTTYSSFTNTTFKGYDNSAIDKNIYNGTDNNTNKEVKLTEDEIKGGFTYQ